MLGRNAARPLVGITPSRLVAAYSTATSHRVAHWILSKPYAMVHMQRYLALNANHLLTSTQKVATPTLVSLDGSSCSPLHTSSAQPCPSPSSPTATPSPSSATKGAAAAAAEAMQPATFPLEDDDFYPSPTGGYYSPLSASMTAEELAAQAVGNSTPTSGAAAVASKNAVAFNYLLAASWHPKPRQPQRPTNPTQRRPEQILQQRLAKSSLLGSDSDSDGDNVGSSGSSGDERTFTPTSTTTDRLADIRGRPFPGKVNAGEDAFFHISTPSRVALGVADGVGGWAAYGVDPSLFSWALMDNAENVARLTDMMSPEEQLAAHSSDSTSTTVTPKVLDAQSILDGAYSELVNSGKVKAGSSTACILSLCKSTGTLKASNLGDSSFLLIRDNQCIYESATQQHSFNCPYQLTILPEEERESRNRKNFIMNVPTDAVQTSQQLKDGDVIVLATDGFWDNVFKKEALELVDRELGDIIRESHREDEISSSELMSRVQALSKRLTNTARRFSADKERQTPFSQSARQSLRFHRGGKVDDITVIVTLVRSVL